MQRVGRGKNKRAIWSAQDAVVLKWVEMQLRERLPAHPLCEHYRGHGGGKHSVHKMERSLRTEKWAYVCRTDIQGFYGRIRRGRLLRQIKRHVRDPNLLNIVHQYLHYSVEWGGEFYSPPRGICRGCALSPLLAGFCLWAMDTYFEAQQGHLRYVRYMDDVVIFTRTRWHLRRAVRALNVFFASGGYGQHPDKTFIGKTSKGFDWMGIMFNRSGCVGVAPRAMANHRERLRRLYEQAWRYGKRGLRRRVTAYVRRWKIWRNYMLPEECMARSGAYVRGGETTGRRRTVVDHRDKCGLCPPTLSPLLGLRGGRGPVQSVAGIGGWMASRIVAWCSAGSGGIVRPRGRVAWVVAILLSLVIWPGIQGASAASMVPYCSDQGVFVNRSTGVVPKTLLPPGDGYGGGAVGYLYPPLGTYTVNCSISPNYDNTSPGYVYGPAAQTPGIWVTRSLPATSNQDADGTWMLPASTGAPSLVGYRLKFYGRYVSCTGFDGTVTVNLDEPGVWNRGTVNGTPAVFLPCKDRTTQTGVNITYSWEGAALLLPPSGVQSDPSSDHVWVIPAALDQITFGYQFGDGVNGVTLGRRTGIDYHPAARLGLDGDCRISVNGNAGPLTLDWGVTEPTAPGPDGSMGLPSKTLDIQFDCLGTVRASGWNMHVYQQVRGVPASDFTRDSTVVGSTDPGVGFRINQYDGNGALLGGEIGTTYDVGPAADVFQDAGGNRTTSSSSLKVTPVYTSQWQSGMDTYGRVTAVATLDMWLG